MTFDIGGLRSSLELRCETSHKVVHHICRFSLLRCTWRDFLWYLVFPFQGKVLALGDLLVYLMVDETLFLLVVRVDPDLTVGLEGSRALQR